MTVRLRKAQPTDAGAIGEILYQFQEETEWMPKLYTGAELISFCGQMIDEGWITVAEVGGRVQGFLSRDGEEICALYVSPGVKRRGVGRQLLRQAKRETGKLRLNTFEANEWAQSFYLRQGFVEIGRSDGSDIDEELPYISYAWSKEGVT